MRTLACIGAGIAVGLATVITGLLGWIERRTMLAEDDADGWWE